MIIMIGIVRVVCSSISSISSIRSTKSRSCNSSSISILLVLVLVPRTGSQEAAVLAEVSPFFGAKEPSIAESSPPGRLSASGTFSSRKAFAC